MKTVINNALTVKTDGTGAATFTSDIPPMGSSWIVTFFIANATATSAHTAYKNGSIVGQWTGGNTYGPIQIQAGETLTIQSTSLAINTNYQAIQQGAGFSGSDLQTMPFLLPANTSIPAPAAPSIQYVQAALPKTVYESNYTLINGIYTITCPTTIITHLDFFDSNGNLIISADTISGSVVVNLPQMATKTAYYTDSGTGITNISILNSGTNIPFAPAFTLETLTGAGTYTNTGNAYVMAVGAGAGGGSGLTTYGAGGGSGGVNTAIVKLTGNIAYSCGAKGIGGTGDTIGTPGGTTTFGTLTATGGQPGNVGSAPPPPYPTGGLGGTPNGAKGGDAQNGPGVVNTLPNFSLLFPGTTSSGAASSVGVGAGVGIGHGGDGAYHEPGHDGTGYGSGGGGNTVNKAGDGAPGVIYIIRF